VNVYVCMGRGQEEEDRRELKGEYICIFSILFMFIYECLLYAYPVDMNMSVYVFRERSWGYL
jgi:hypothetical protein